jgi:hypothetical protein
MSSWRSQVASFFGRGRVARAEVKQAKEARREGREAEELERARSGADRFPPMRG